VKAWISNEDGLRLMGEIPPGVVVEAYAVTASDIDHPPPSDPAGVEFWVPPFLGGPAVVPLARTMPDLRAVQLMTAGAETWVGKLPEGVTLCDARGVHDTSTSEWVLAAVLGYLRDFPRFARAQAARRWDRKMTDELAGKRVLIVGAGSIGEAIARRLAPFEVTITRVARTPRAGVHGVDELPGLLPEADIVVLIVPMTSETAGLVDAKFLAAMPDGALLVNAARGPVVDTAALVAEVGSGRLGAALDVTDPEPLPSDHPLWTMENVLLTPHVGGSVHGFFARAYRLAGAQLRRYASGEPLDNVVTGWY
jgi:phosphoglycerate dehydrogenase-like enzyme